MIICFLGPPGCGKSTQMEMVKRIILNEANLNTLRVPNLLKDDSITYPFITKDEHSVIQSMREEADICREQGFLAPIVLDEILFNVANRMVKKGKFVLMDGSPRGFQQAVLFSKYSDLLPITMIIHLYFSDKAFEYSVSRQFSRESIKGGMIEAERKLQRYKNKFSVYANDTVPGLDYLRKGLVPVCDINALQQKEQVYSQIEKFITKHILTIMQKNHLIKEV